MVHGMHVHLLSFIYIRKCNSQSINGIMCRSSTWNFTQTTQQMRTVPTRTCMCAPTHTHTFMPLAEVWLSLCLFAQNTQSLSKFLQISLVLNLIHTNKICKKYSQNIIYTVQQTMAFTSFAFRFPHQNSAHNFLPERIPSEDNFKSCILLIHELQYTMCTLYG
jgi:hypothetical protein